MTSSRARLPLLGGLIMLLVLASGAIAAQADTLDQQQTGAIIAQGIAGPSNMYPVSEAQTFTAGLSGWIGRVQLWVSGDDSDTGGLTVEIRTVSSGAPSATVLASTSVPAAAISSTGGWAEADFSSPAPVSSGTQYAIVAYAGGSDVLGWYSENGNPYAGGEQYFSSASPPSSWTATTSSTDLAFREYVESSLPGTATAAPGSLPFGTQAQTTVSAPQTVTITNTGQADTELDVTGVSFVGADPGDFFVGSDNCGAPIPPSGSCQVTVSFAPQAQGSRAARLLVSSNDPNGPAIVGLSGTGGQLPQGPTGPQGTPGTMGATGATGATGASGSSGATGSQGAAGAGGPQGQAGQNGAPGKVELLMCKTVTRHHKKQVRCTGRLVSGTFALTGSGVVAATVHRGNAMYATGARLDLGGGRSELVLADVRPVSGGRYTLTLRYRSGRRSITSTRRVTLN